MSEAPLSLPNAVPSAHPVTEEGFDRIGDYELLELIGQGGMGRVFKARQLSLGRIVALKVLPPDLARNQSFTLRFLQEARASGKLVHPNVVQGIDCAQDEHSGLWYFAMEFIDGHSLADELKRCRALPEERVIEIGIAIASALEAAAKQGIVHRDIKPENILLSRTGEIKLADLGVAKISTDADASLTRSEDMVGTPYYVSPEQARGKRDQIDTRSDIYSLGATLFHLATGQPPFLGDSSTDVMVKHVNEKPPLAHRVDPSISEALSRVIAKTMQKQPNLRYQTPVDLRVALDRARLGVFVGRGETSRVAAVQGKRTTRAQVMTRDRDSEARIAAAARSSSQQNISPVTGLTSRSYLWLGTGALLLSLSGLYALLFMDNGPRIDRPSKTGQPDAAPTMPPTPSNPPDPTAAAGPTAATPLPAPPSTQSAPETDAPRSAPTTPAPGSIPGMPDWYPKDLGAVKTPGQVTVTGETLSLTASGSDIYHQSDEGFFVYRCLRGDGSIQICIEGIQGGDILAKTGVMFRETLASDARNVYLHKSPRGLTAFAQRSETGGPTRSMRGLAGPMPFWIRLTRTGNTFSGYVSKDGVKWSSAGSVELAMGRDVYVGLAATSHKATLTSESVISHLQFEGALTPLAEWPATPANTDPN